MSENLPTGLSFAELSEPRSGAFEALLHLYEDAIPARERKSSEALRAMVASPDYKVVVARRSGDLIGFAILLVGRTMGLLEYMAIDPRQRGEGFGSALYRHCRDAELPPTLPLLAEVDSDREESADRELRARRKQFYLRLGCRQVIGLDYVLPLPGAGRPPRMDLLVDGDMLADFAPRAMVAKWLREVYHLAYGCRSDDLRLLTMVNSLQEEVPLR
jgi:GNAT superfamily N-acetyltransferase